MRILKTFNIFSSEYHFIFIAKMGTNKTTVLKKHCLKSFVAFSLLLYLQAEEKYILSSLH